MSQIVDRFGNPVRSGLANALYRTPSQAPGDFRNIAKPRPKTYEAVSAWQRREMVDVSRVIAAGVPNIDSALVQAGEFSIGDSWHIKYTGTNRAWGKRRDDWFNKSWANDCNLRGKVNDWRSTLRQLVWSRKVQGDYALIFDGAAYKDSTGKEFNPTGKFRVIKYDRINSGLNGSVSVGNGLEQIKEVGRASYQGYFTNGWGGWIGMYIINDPASPFDGQRLLDGVIVDANMTVLGYRVTGFNENGMPTYCDVPKERIHLNFAARKDTDMIRGFPELAEAILPIMNLDDVQYLITMAMKLASALAVTRESSDGNPSRGGRANYDEDSTDSAGNTVTKRRSVEEIFPGIMELATNNKEALKVLEFDRPSMNEEAFTERVETALMHKLWPRSLIYEGAAGRAGARAIAIQATTICTWDQCCVERDASWLANQATAFAMEAGYIPGNDNLGDPYQHVFTVPAKFTVDEGNDAKMRLLALGRCIISRGIICEMDGYLAEEIEEQRQAEVERTLSAAEELAKKHPSWSAKEIALMLDNAGTQMSFADAEKEQVIDTVSAPLGPDGEPETGAEAPPANKPTKDPNSKRSSSK